MLIGNENAFIAKLSYPLPTDFISENSSNNFFSIFPNPFYNMINISTTDAAEFQVTIYDLTGRELLSSGHGSASLFMTSSRASINTATLAAGLYILQLTTRDGDVFNYKVIKE
jgi:hypothetical protein